jgi:hypothetical protein
MRARQGILVFVSVLAACLPALVATSYLRDIRAARERVATGSRMAQTPCGPIEYAVAGDGPPVLVVDGAAGGWDQGFEFGAPLAAIFARAHPVRLLCHGGRIHEPGSARAAVLARAGCKDARHSLRKPIHDAEMKACGATI